MKIFKDIKKYIFFIINIFIRFILGAVYFTIFFPFFIFIRLFTDFLDIKNYNSIQWLNHIEIKDIEKFLNQQ